MAASPARAVLDTNVFVAAGFKRNSASARIVDQVRAGDLRMVWNNETRGETQHILSKIPPISWIDVAELFREEDRFPGPTSPEKFDYIPDHDDRKFAALAEAAGAVLITNDDHLLSNREPSGLEILTPAEYWKRRQE
jgi:predicted nucleic acid-binding protein